MAGKMFQPNFLSQTIEPVLIYSSNNFDNLRSFVNWHYGKTSLLIEAGFKSTGMDDILMCPICNVTTRYTEWCDTKEPHEKHIELKPTCEYAKEVNDMKKCRKVVSSRKDTIHVSPTLSLKELRVFELQSSFEVPRELAENLASNGYLYDRGMDAVRCSSCHIVIEKEELMSDLSVIHARFSPVCTLIMQHINKDRLTIIQNSWKQKNNTGPKSTDICFGCQTMGHRRRNCSKFNNPKIAEEDMNDKYNFDCVASAKHHFKEQLNTLQLDSYEYEQSISVQSVKGKRKNISIIVEG
ncbi:unnamed protein product [Mytilus edulis]|uniref:CCHC-type domain-containing protein n=1 Tax=Mytilus edulis TaxID=6550 RepID=A0A8S3Q5C6_MYTED|nr:unnamed protein product [Mytilus edulis]